MEKVDQRLLGQRTQNCFLENIRFLEGLSQRQSVFDVKIPLSAWSVGVSSLAMCPLLCLQIILGVGHIV